MSNPYQPPAFDASQPEHTAYPATHPGFGWVNQVRIVAVLNCVQGALEIALGLMLMGAALFVPAIMQAQKQGMPPGAPGLPPQQMEQILTITYLAMGTPIVLLGALRIFAGIIEITEHAVRLVLVLETNPLHSRADWQRRS